MNILTLRYYWRKFKRLRLYDLAELHALSEHAHLRKLFAHCKVDCVFDVGANQGQYALALRNRVGYSGYIFSFEPDPTVAKLARERARAEGDTKWLVFDIALSDRDGGQTFHRTHSSQGSSLSLPSDEAKARGLTWIAVENTITVPCERLESVYARLKEQYNFSTPFLKLDTQGFDAKVVEGGQGVINSFVGLQSELSIVRLYEDSLDFRTALARYEELGFVLSALVPNNAGYFPQMVETDCIMVRRDLITVTSDSK